MSRKVLIDVDGVCVDLLGRCSEVLAGRGVVFEPSGVRSYDFRQGDYGCTRDEVLGCFSDSDVMLGLEYSLYPGVGDGLKALRGIGYDLVGYTGLVSDTFFSERKRLMNVLGLRGEPYVGVKPVIGGVFALIEDNPSVIRDWVSSCGVDMPYIFYVTRGYNEGVDFSHERVIRVTGLDEAAERLVKLM